MQSEIVSVDAGNAVGVEIRTANDRAQEIGELWGRFLGENLAAHIDGRVGDEVVAVYCEYEGDHTKPYTFFLGCPVRSDAAVPEGMVARTIPAGTYTRVVAEGAQPQALIQAWMEIWEMPIERRFEVDYEVHDPARPDVVEIFVGTGGQVA